MLRPTVAVGLKTLATIGTSFAPGNAPSLAPCDGCFLVALACYPSVSIHEFC